MTVYSIEMQVCATLYVKADSPEAAMAKAKLWEGLCLEAEGTDFSNERYEDLAIDSETFSPAMTVQGVWPGAEVEVADE